ncbi:LCP family protein [Collinsella tanakaei]|uniref:LCP family protein n=1 Tax=Collinsella tanakaei TaxID=626935 RepID=UPI0019567951|nr:LCP family protein [Collinsella tanakaei]MBM6779729.1 LCP family protein [Collinsella tanakaei]
MKKKPVQDARRLSTGAASRIYSRENVGRYSERARQRRTGKRIRRVIVVTLVALLACVGTAAGVWFSSIAGRLNNGAIITPDLLLTLVDSNVTREPFYMLLLGTDGRPGEDSYRADSIVLARIDAPEKEVTLISIPRDTKIEYDGSTMKINAAHVYDGAEGMVEAVNDLCDIKISHYAEINFEGMQQLVDALGGVEVNVPDRIDDPKAADFVIEPGLQTLNGEQALAFCRSRAYTDGDYTRMRHQRIFLAALANTILNKMDVGNLMGIVDSLSSMVVTDMSVQDIISLVNAMRGMNTDNIWTANLPSWAGEDTWIDGQSYVFVHEDELEEMMERVNAGEDPQGPQTMGTGGESATTGDLSNNEADDWAYGTATTSSSSSEEDSEYTEEEYSEDEY